MTKKQEKEYLVKGYGHTNEVIASDQSAVEVKRVMCGDGKERDLWLCPYSLITKLVASKAEGQLSFTVYHRANRDTKAYKWPYAKKQKITRRAAEKKKLLFKMPPEKLTPVR